ncbi:Hydrophobic protein LTI6A, partial [Mucuna pruriens]
MPRWLVECRHIRIQLFHLHFAQVGITLTEEVSKLRKSREKKMAGDGAATCIDILLAIILPPLGVFLKYGCQVEFWICLVLTLFGYIPGIIYAVYAITK